MVGSQYLNDTGQCVDNDGTVPQCALNEAIGPFLSSIAIGVCLAMLVGHLIYLLVHRVLDPAPRDKYRSERPAAKDLDDPYLQIASWNMAPRTQTKISSARARIEAQVEKRAAERRTPEPILGGTPEPILEVDPRVRPESKVGRIGSRDRPMPTPRRLA